MGPKLSKYDEEPEVGDLIEISRRLYQHWAVYVGDGFIVHVTSRTEVPEVGANSMMSARGEKAIVKKEKLWDVVESNRWKIHNSLDKQYQHRPAHVIVKEACAMVGRELPYCAATRNCEHFATELRYGKAESRQVHEAVGGSILAILGGLLVAAIAVPVHLSRR